MGEEGEKKERIEDDVYKMGTERWKENWCSSIQVHITIFFLHSIKKKKNLNPDYSYVPCNRLVGLKPGPICFHLPSAVFQSCWRVEMHYEILSRRQDAMKWVVFADVYKLV